MRHASANLTHLWLHQQELLDQKIRYSRWRCVFAVDVASPDLRQPDEPHGKSGTIRNGLIWLDRQWSELEHYVSSGEGSAGDLINANFESQGIRNCGSLKFLPFDWCCAQEARDHHPRCWRAMSVQEQPFWLLPCGLKMVVQQKTGRELSRQRRSLREEHWKVIQFLVD